MTEKVSPTSCGRLRIHRCLELQSNNCHRLGDFVALRKKMDSATSLCSAQNDREKPITSTKKDTNLRQSVAIC